MDQVFEGIGIVGIVVYIAIIVLMIAANWKIYTKAGQPGWASIIPIYNIVVLLQIVKKPIWWIILMLIPFVNFVIAILLIHNLSKVFGKGVGFTLGLFFLPFIFYPILGFGDAQYEDSNNESSEDLLDN